MMYYLYFNKSCLKTRGKAKATPLALDDDTHLQYQYLGDKNQMDLCEFKTTGLYKINVEANLNGSGSHL